MRSRIPLNPKGCQESILGGFFGLFCVCFQHSPQIGGERTVLLLSQPFEPLDQRTREPDRLLDFLLALSHGSDMLQPNAAECQDSSLTLRLRFDGTRIELWDDEEYDSGMDKPREWTINLSSDGEIWYDVGADCGEQVAVIERSALDEAIRIIRSHECAQFPSREINEFLDKVDPVRPA